MSDFAEKAELIEQILNKIMPIPENAPENVKDSIDGERQMLVMRAGFNNMSVQQLRAKLA